MFIIVLMRPLYPDYIRGASSVVPRMVDICEINTLLLISDAR